MKKEKKKDSELSGGKIADGRTVMSSEQLQNNVKFSLRKGPVKIAVSETFAHRPPVFRALRRSALKLTVHVPR